MVNEYLRETGSKETNFLALPTAQLDNVLTAFFIAARHKDLKEDTAESLKTLHCGLARCCVLNAYGKAETGALSFRECGVSQLVQCDVQHYIFAQVVWGVLVFRSLRLFVNEIFFF